MKRTGINEKKTAQRIRNPTSPRLLTLKRAAEYIGLTTWGMREAIWAGLIPVVKLGPNGRKMFIDTNDIEKFIAENKSVI